MKTAVVSLRLGDLELAQLDALCDELGQTRGDLLGNLVWACLVWRPRIRKAHLAAGDGPCEAGRPHRVPMRTTQRLADELAAWAAELEISTAGLVRALVAWAAVDAPGGLRLCPGKRDA